MIKLNLNVMVPVFCFVCISHWIVFVTALNFYSLASFSRGRFYPNNSKQAILVVVHVTGGSPKCGVTSNFSRQFSYHEAYACTKSTDASVPLYLWREQKSLTPNKRAMQCLQLPLSLDCSPLHVHDLVIINVTFGNNFQVQLYSKFTEPNKFIFFSLLNEQFTPLSCKIPSILVLYTNKTLSHSYFTASKLGTGSLYC